METRSASPGASSAKAAPAEGPARRAATPPPLTNARRERGPCELAPWAALRLLAAEFSSSLSSPSPERLLPPAARRPARRGGTSSPEERPGEQDPASGHALSSSESSVSLTADRSTRGGGGRPPAGWARPSHEVLVLAARRASWRPQMSAGSVLRRWRMGGTDSERCPERCWRFSPRGARPCPRAASAESAGAPPLAARLGETKPELSPVCASSSEASTCWPVPQPPVAEALAWVGIGTGRTLWRGGGCRVAGGRVAAPGTLRLARLGTRGPLAGTLVARLGPVGRRPNATRAPPTARGALTARVPRGTDSDGASLTAARLQLWGTDLGLTA